MSSPPSPPPSSGFIHSSLPPSSVQTLTKCSWRYISTLSLSLLGRSGPKVPLTWLLFLASVYLSFLLYQRDRIRRLQRQHQKNLELYWSKFDRYIRFGFDIGGTLCKLVYFEPHAVTPQQAAVKARVDQFIKGSTTYGQTGNRDTILQFSCKQIQGTFHFLKFQTSMMQNFINIVKQYDLSPVGGVRGGGGGEVGEAEKWKVGGRRSSLPGKGRGTHALTSSSAAVLSFSTAPSSTSSSGSKVGKVNGKEGVKLGATAWYTLTDPTSPPLPPIGASSLSSTLSLPSSSSSSPPAIALPDAATPDGITSPFDSPLLPNATRLLPPASPSSSSSSPSSSHSSLHSIQPLPVAPPPPPSSNERRLSDPLPSHPPFTGLPGSPIVCGTGGGAYKFSSLFSSSLSIDLRITDELESLVKGIDFMIHTVPDECYYLSSFLFKHPLERETHPPLSYPYLVCNIGSGVSILKVSGPHQFERVGGTSLGGGTFLGLCRALTGCKDFEEALQLAERGHSSAVDLLVGDIYGGDYAELGLAKENVAASFGKLVRGGSMEGVRKEDLAKAALVMITNNISSLVNLYAHQVLHVPQMIFVGNFLTHNEIAKRGLAFATDFWSQQTAKALFLRHEGYFGAVGSLLGS